MGPVFADTAILPDDGTASASPNTTPTPIAVQPAQTPCPSWQTVIDREGWDGGHLTVQIDTCEYVEYIHYSKAQNSQPGFIAELSPDDIFIEWDEDMGDEARMLFEFTGECVVETPPYIQISGNPYTRWTVYRVITAGTLTKTTSGYNEHEALHLQERLFSLEKTDGLNDPNACISPDEQLTYSIDWANEHDNTFENCWIIDWLPAEVDYPFQATDPNYNPQEHFYVWDLGTIGPYESGTLTLPVMVTPRAAPLSTLRNVAQLYSDDTLLASTSRVTDVCDWDTDDPNVIYVDRAAAGYNNGTTWADAFVSLQDAVASAARKDPTQGIVIYAAEGRYNPGPYESSSFVLPENLSVYGGFPTGGGDPNQRNPERYPTVLTGKISEGDRCVSLVTMGHNTLLDGFKLTRAASENIYGNNADFTIRNCTITESNGYGVYARNGNVRLTWCTVAENGYTGVYHTGLSKSLDIHNSRILRNSGYGVYSRESTPTITNCLVAQNGQPDNTPDGIRIFQPYLTPILVNNTIAYNLEHGISFADNHDISGDPNFLDWPEIRNCIIWYNNPDSRQLDGFDPDIASYSFIQDCNEVNNNQNLQPLFAYGTDANDLHLAYNSPCRDQGSLLADDAGLFDIDGESRWIGDRIDVGADEIYACDGDLTEDDIYRPLDLQADGRIDLLEFVSFSQAWLSRKPDSSDPPGQIGVWNPRWNLDNRAFSRDCIDLADLAVLIEDGWWMWQACWRQSQRERMANLPPP